MNFRGMLRSPETKILLHFLNLELEFIMLGCYGLIEV